MTQQQIVYVDRNLLKIGEKEKEAQVNDRYSNTSSVKRGDSFKKPKYDIFNDDEEPQPLNVPVMEKDTPAS